MLTHIDEYHQPTMVNVTHKEMTSRSAKAQCTIFLPKEVSDCFKDDEIQTAKGPVFATAIIAGTLAVKKTFELIPLCHTLPIDSCRFEINKNNSSQIVVMCEVKTFAKTGIEMEALTGASIAALTIYDMCKALSHNIRIEDIKLLEKSGGKNDYRLYA